MITFTEDFQRRLRAVLAKHTGREIPADVGIDVISDGAGYDDSRGMDYWIEIRSTGYPYATYSYDEPGAWPRLLADLEAVPDETEENKQPKTALDVIEPLTSEQSDVLVMISDRGRGRLAGADFSNATGLYEHGLAYLNSGHWNLTALGRDAVAKIKAAAAPANPPLAFVRVEQITPAAPAQWYAWDELGAKYYLRYRRGQGTVEADIGTDRQPVVVREFRYGDSLDGAISLTDFAEQAGIALAGEAAADELTRLGQQMNPEGYR